MMAVAARRVLIYGGLLALAVWLATRSTAVYFFAMFGIILAAAVAYWAINGLIRRLPATDALWSDVQRAWWVAVIPTALFQAFR